MKKLILLSLIILIAGLIEAGENNKAAENKLIDIFENYSSHWKEIIYGDYSEKTKSKVKKILSDSSLFDHSFPELGKLINVAYKKGYELKFFSWDEMTGGSWHDYAVLAQFRTSTGAVSSKYIDFDIGDDKKGMINDRIIDIFKYSFNEKDHYLCFGYGTFGGGMQHESIMIFTLNNDKLKLCKSCVPEKFRRIEYSRSEELEMKYDEENQTISFKEYVFDKERGFPEFKGKYVKLKLKNGKFVRVK